MKQSTIRKIEDILRDYPKMDKYIEQREQELRYPMKPADDNVGGGKTSLEHDVGMLNTLITIDDDKRINALKRQRMIIDDCLDEAGKDTTVIINELYFKKHQQYTIDGLIVNGLLQCSRRSAFRLKNEFISACATQLGLYEVD